MRRTVTASWMTALALSAALAACDDDPTGDGTEEFSATLAPEAGVTSSATGSAGFVLDGGVISYTIDVQDITAVTAAHIHGPASASQDAGVIVPLFAASGGATGAVNGDLVTSSFVAADITAANVSLDSLLVLMRNGNAYVNVHTTANPAGEIRGQITAQ